MINYIIVVGVILISAYIVYVNIKKIKDGKSSCSSCDGCKTSSSIKGKCFTIQKNTDK